MKKLPILVSVRLVTVCYKIVNFANRFFVRVWNQLKSGIISNMQLIKAFHVRITGKCVGNNVFCKHPEVTHV